jgi:hypothetical protein
MTRSTRSTRQARKRYFPSMHALAATQAVLAPLLGQRRPAFPPDPLTVDVVRLVWQERARRLADAGYPPLNRRGALEGALACAHALLAPENRPEALRPCHLDHVCPFCHGLRAALTFENVLAALRRQPGVRLVFVRGVRHDAPGVCGEVGRLWERGRALLAVRAGSRVRRAGQHVSRVPDEPMGVARAVGWFRRYPPGLLLRPVDRVLRDLDRAGQAHQSTATGIFRSARSVQRISQCRTDLVAPLLTAEPRLPARHLHEAELLAAGLPACFDHEGFIRRQLTLRLGDACPAVTYLGMWPVIELSVFFDSRPRNRALRPFLRGWPDGLEVAICVLPEGAGYGVIRPLLSNEEESQRARLASEGRMGDLGALFIFPHRGRPHVLERAGRWARCEARLLSQQAEAASAARA